MVIKNNVPIRWSVSNVVLACLGKLDLGMGKLFRICVKCL